MCRRHRRDRNRHLVPSPSPAGAAGASASWLPSMSPSCAMVGGAGRGRCGGGGPPTTSSRLAVLSSAHLLHTWRPPQLELSAPAHEKEEQGLPHPDRTSLLYLLFQVINDALGSAGGLWSPLELLFSSPLVGSTSNRDITRRRLWIWIHGALTMVLLGCPGRSVPIHSLHFCIQFICAIQM